MPPVGFLRALSSGLAARGVRLFVRTPVIAIVEGDCGARLTTAGDRVRARRMPHAFRRLPDDRILCRGRADITGRNPDRRTRCRELERAAVEVFPQLEGTPVDSWRTGFVGVGEHGFPHPGCPGQRIVQTTGYPGRGVGVSHLPGRCTARMTCGRSVPPGPMDGPGFRSWPLHKTRLPLMQATAWLSLQAPGPAQHHTRTPAVSKMPEQRFTFTRSEDDKAR